MENNKNFSFWDSKFILGFCIIIASLVGAYVFYQAKTYDNALSVTGSATKQVVSDHVKWISTISRITKLSTLKSGYTMLATDLANTKDFLEKNNVAVGDIVITPVFMEQNWDQNQGQTEKTYTIRQTIEVNSSDVSGIASLANNTSALIDKGVIFSTQSLEYTYTKLSNERISMLSDAMKDAQARASMLAESTGKKIGKLKSASSGVVQVLSENALNVSDFGTYDTSKINKTIMLTVKASFTLE